MPAKFKITENGVVPIDEPFRPIEAPYIRGDFKPFVSPVDGSVINTSRDLANHNKRHGVSNDPDSLLEKTTQYLDSYGKVDESQKGERIDALVEAYDRASVPGFNRKKEHEDTPLQ